MVWELRLPIIIVLALFLPLPLHEVAAVERSYGSMVTHQHCQRGDTHQGNIVYMYTSTHNHVVLVKSQYRRFNAFCKIKKKTTYTAFCKIKNPKP